MANSQQRCVFVGNIPYDATEEQLIQICEEVGPVVSFRLVIDRETGKPKGYGFCEYKDEETALSARRNLQGYAINGRQLRVDFAENDKNSDRNREKGRCGPGLASNVGGLAILGDSALHQPIGLPLAATAASVMAGALGDVQTAGMSSKQNGLLGHSGLGNDPLTHYMAKMSWNQLYEIMSEIKVMAIQNKELARQLLLASPQLPKALFQAQIMLGMVKPQVLQMQNIRQSPGSQLQSQLQEGKQGQQSALRPIPGQIPLLQNNMQIGLMSRLQEGQVPALPQSASVNSQPSLLLQQGLIQPRFQHPHQAQSQVLVESLVPGQSGVSTVSSIQTQPYSGLSVPLQTPALATSTALKQQVQPPLLQPPRPVGAVNSGHNAQLRHPNAGLQHPSLLLRPLSSQPSFQPGSSALPGGPETVHRDAERSAQATDNGTWATRSNNYSNMPSGLPEQTNIVTDSSEGMNHPSKLARLKDGRQDSHRVVNVNTSATGSLAANLASSTDGVQQYEKKFPPQLQLPPEVESTLLQQVMTLTPEQLRSLPPEQQQQVIQLQQMLRLVVRFYHAQWFGSDGLKALVF
ncbi:cleavage stimulating factor 64-like isoform X3 [Macadamia integrifolia]|uniref:cleavage stimulating factor 64-like isoform X3 n=1 Tax=Macadamia integrifolia TaxID=60698 RepID=UPI001C4E428E|nr:cleavage stimulating factor 64-like isoform X3 [Macadamia integrifolia]